ncbi:MAG: MraY family glycosyltransferase [Eubacteriales bacterium]|nr:MraY family glycosyltransferase [Eubacteriales bacterium]
MLTTQFIITLAAGAAITAATTPLVKKLAFRIGAVDIPKDNRRMHSKPIARIGGLAIIAGFILSIFISCIVTGKSPIACGIFDSYTQMFGYLAGIIIIISVGIADDISPIRSKVKLGFQLAAAIVLVVTGTHIEILTNPFSASGVITLSPFISYPISILWIMAVTNAMNFIDGLDGLAAGVSFISSVSLMIISILLGRWEAAIMTAAIAGSTIGFLPFNFNPARIFMGDTGATFLGFTLAAVSIQGTLKSYAAIAIAVPILVLAFPLFDTLFAVLRRLFTGKPLMQADRGHLHHRLIDMGISHRKSVLILYLLSALLAIAAVVLADKSVFTTAVLVIVLLIVIIWSARFIMVMRRRRHFVNTGADTDKKNQ